MAAKNRDDVNSAACIVGGLRDAGANDAKIQHGAQVNVSPAATETVRYAGYLFSYRLFRCQNRSQKNTIINNSLYSHSGIVPKERALIPFTPIIQILPTIQEDNIRVMWWELIVQSAFIWHLARYQLPNSPYYDIYQVREWKEKIEVDHSGVKGARLPRKRLQMRSWVSYQFQNGWNKLNHFDGLFGVRPKRADLTLVRVTLWHIYKILWRPKGQILAAEK